MKINIVENVSARWCSALCIRPVCHVMHVITKKPCEQDELVGCQMIAVCLDYNCPALCPFIDAPMTLERPSSRISVRIVECGLPVRWPVWESASNRTLKTTIPAKGKDHFSFGFCSLLSYYRPLSHIEPQQRPPLSASASATPPSHQCRLGGDLS